MVREKRKGRKKNTTKRFSAFRVLCGQITCLISVFICVHLRTNLNAHSGQYKPAAYGCTTEVQRYSGSVAVLLFEVMHDVFGFIQPLDLAVFITDTQTGHLAFAALLYQFLLPLWIILRIT